MKNIKFIIYILLLSACEKVVYIDLNTSDPKLVVEANITDSKYGSGYYLNAVKLSRTVNYYDGNVFPAINNASIFITDDLGNIDTLKPMNLASNPGMYLIDKMKGVAGRSYSLKIIADGKEYTAFSTMPYKVPIDSIAFEQRINRQGESTYRVRCVFTDPPNVANYYRLKLFSSNNNLRNDSNNVRVLSDRLTDGKQMSLSYRSGFFVGDSIEVMLESIDKATYEFYRTLPNAGGDLNPFLSSPPSNPVNNINSGLGYFAAYSFADTLMIVK